MSDPDEALDRPAPHSIGAEQATLGGMMLSEPVIGDVLTILGASAEAFYRPAHQMIYSAIIDLWDRGDQADVQMIADELQRRGQLDRCGGPVKVLELVEKVAIPGNAVGHARTVSEHHARRSALEVLSRGLQQLESGSTDPAAVIASVTDELSDQAAYQAKESSSWAPVDLGPCLRGEKKQAAPTIGLARSDGLQLIYPGKEHSIIGETESGKSWFSVACAANEMLFEGRIVVYVHFEEADPADTVERLQALGVPDAIIATKLRFVGPEEPVQPRLLEALLADSPSLVILDGVNEGMSLHGCDTRHEDGVAQFRRRVIKPCTAAGAATLAGDHVVKDREQRGRAEMGSIHKGNGLTGARILLETIDPFGRGKRGASAVYVTKDRPGHLRRNGKSGKLPGKTMMGVFAIDDTRMECPHLDLKFWAPSDDRAAGGLPIDAKSDQHSKDDDHVFKVVAELVTEGLQVTGKQVRAKTSLGTNKTIDALERLVIDGRLNRADGPRGANIYTPADEGES